MTVEKKNMSKGTHKELLEAETDLVCGFTLKSVW